MGQGSLKDLAKAHGNEGLEWAKDAQDSVRINLAEVLGNVNYVKEKYMADPKEAQQV